MGCSSNPTGEFVDAYQSFFAHISTRKREVYNEGTKANNLGCITVSKPML